MCAVFGSIHRTACKGNSQKFSAAPVQILLVRPVGLIPHRRVRGPVEALLASARRVRRAHHRLLLSPASCRREAPIVRVDVSARATSYAIRLFTNRL